MIRLSSARALAGEEQRMTVRKKNMSRTIGYGYVGRWNDGTLGWCLPARVSPCMPSMRLSERAEPHPDWSNIGEPSYLCKITIQLVKNKRGKPTMRKIKP
jgi:hypothetical protein